MGLSRGAGRFGEGYLRWRRSFARSDSEASGGRNRAADEAVRLCNKISQPLLRWLDAMMGKDSGAGPERLLGELNIAYDAGSADQVSR